MTGKSAAPLAWAGHVQSPCRAAWTGAITVALVAVLVLVSSTPSYVPRGRIAFQTNRDGNWEIYVMAVNGTGQSRLTGDSGEDWVPRWVPPQAGTRASHLVFTSNRDGQWHVYLLGVGTSTDAASSGFAASLTSGPAHAGDPTPSRAGLVTKLTGQTENNRDPAVSPDGRTLAFSALDGGQREVYLMDLDTGKTANLTQHSAEDWLPSWSPDGRQIAFVSDRDGNFEIYRLDLSTGSLSNLTDHPADDWVPAWSPSGRHLVFQSNRDGNWEIYLLDLTTGELRNLTCHPADDWDPAWSPDGRQIAFMSWRDGNREIYVMDAQNGGSVLRLTRDPAADKNPTWTW